MNTIDSKENNPKIRSYLIPELVVFWGETSSEILHEIDIILKDENLENEKFGFIKQVSHATQDRFNAMEAKPTFRAAVTAYGEAELHKKLVQIKKMISANPDEPLSYAATGLFYGVGDTCGKLAYLFPGQGAQYLGMGGPLAAAFPEAARTWAKLGEMRFAGESIREVVFPPEPLGDKEAKAAFFKLASAEWTNPSISVVGEAIYRLLEKMGVRPDAVASHSFGDISAFRAAGVLTDEDMIRATRVRGELGVSCPLATRGCVLVVPEPAERIQQIFKAYNIQEAWIANYNTPNQTVLSGVKESILKAQEAFKQEGINTRLMPISGAPHCPLAVDVGKKFFDYLEALVFKPAVCDVYSFAFGRRVKENDPQVYKKLIRAHIEKPVHFMKQIKTMYNEGVRIFVEVAPSDILTNLVHQILGDTPHLAVHTDERKGDPVLAFLNATAELFKEGRISNFDVLWEGYTIPETASDDELSALNDAKVKQLKRLKLELSKIDHQEQNKKA